MKILFLGTLCKEDEEQTLISNSTVGIHNSIILFQRNLIHGLEFNLGAPVDTINILPVGTFPKYYKGLFIPLSTWHSPNGRMTLTLPTFNIHFAKQFFLVLSAIRYITRWITHNKDHELCIILYDLLVPYLLALPYIRAKYPHVLLCAVVADLPNEFGYDKPYSGIKRFLRTWMGKIQLREIKKLDCFGILTQHMKVPLNIPEGNYEVIEGLSNSDHPFHDLEDHARKVILYTGALNSIYGLDVLLDAFMSINDNNYELWLCGIGDYVPHILKASRADSRIKYLGFLSQKDIFHLQLKATLLINPRQNIGEYTKYSFPSKIIEYLSTGRVVVAYRLDGIPEEYYTYIISPRDNTSAALKQTIVEVCTMPLDYRRQLGIRGRTFVLDRTNPINQCNKLINLLEQRHLSMSTQVRTNK